MKIRRLMMLMIMVGILMVMSACGKPSGTSSIENETKPVKQEEPTNQQDAKQADQEILMIIDQTPKPSEQKSFDFVVKQRPDGYSLTEMQWNSSKSHITNTVQEAAQHGANGEDGFYISGDGQFSGFIYPKSMSGESGEVKFLFHNEQGNELTWKKKITLK